MKVSTFSIIKEDLRVHGGRDFISACKVYFFDASFRVILNYRIGHLLINSRSIFLRQLSNVYRYRLIAKRSCDISFKAKIGRRIKFPHPIAIVIGDNVTVLDDVKIWQSVTLGTDGKSGRDAYPVIGNNCKIYPGSVIVGAIELGDNVVIGANSFVNKSIPAYKTAIGSPAKIL